MKSRWTLLVCLLVVPTGFTAAQTLDSALAFFPMAVGDTWEYASYWGMTAANQFEGYGFSGITGDTLMQNGRVYRVLRSGLDPNHLLSNPAYYRMDSTTANVYSYSPTSGQETLWDSLREGLGHRNQWGSVFAIYNELILGTATVTKSSGMIGYGFHLSYGFGKSREITETIFQEEYLTELVYAKINGKEHGTILAIGRTGPRSPETFQLLQNYPNPFNPTTTIRYALPSRAQVILTVFNTLGQQVATLVNESEDAGFHDVRYDGSSIASGVYFYQLRAGEYVATKSLMVVR
jgi:hypothetical protein